MNLTYGNRWCIAGTCLDVSWIVISSTVELTSSSFHSIVGNVGNGLLILYWCWDSWVGVIGVASADGMLPVFR